MQIRSNRIRVKMDKDFYIQLISTDSIETFKDNSASQFTNIMPHQLELNDGTWSVAVSEVSYTSSFYNVTESCGFAIFDFEFHWTEKDLYGSIHDCLIPAGYYDDPVVLCKLLNDLVDNLKIKKLENKKLFTYDKHPKKFTLHVEDNMYICLIVKGQLIDILGLETRHYSKYQVAFIGKSKDKHYFVKNGKKYYFKNQELSWTSDASGGKAPYVSQMLTINSFLISSNLIRDTIFGSSFSNVMRTCPISGPQGSRIVKEFNKRMYFPVKASTFAFVTVSITDYLGNPINFLEGNLAIVLHFKQNKN